MTVQSLVKLDKRRVVLLDKDRFWRASFRGEPSRVKSLHLLFKPEWTALISSILGSNLKDSLDSFVRLERSLLLL